LNQISGAEYIEADLNGDGELDDTIILPETPGITYIINIFPETGAEQSDTFTLVIGSARVGFTMLKNLSFSEIPEHGYRLSCEMLPLEAPIFAIIDFDPDTLHLKSKGKWVTVYVELPFGFNVTDIDFSTLSLDGAISPEPYPTEIGDYDDDGIPDLMVKFDRESVKEYLENQDLGDGNEARIVVTGETAGKNLEGTDTIRVIVG
jgi:hypothetical protein